MPGRLAAPCTYPGCHVLVRDGSGRCEVHPRAARWGTLAERGQEGKRITGRRGVELRQQMRQEQPLCVECYRVGIIRLATQRDHVVPIAEGGEDVPTNAQPLCDECHREKSKHEAIRGQRTLSPEYEARRLPRDLRRSRVPLSIVCGPPGSGKSTYVRERAGQRDVIIDLDAIMSRMSGLPEHAVKTQWLRPGLEERNAMLRNLAVTDRYEHAWFIIAAPDPAERKHWASMLGGKIILLDTPLDECMRRIATDDTRIGERDRMTAAARAWWSLNGVARYTPVTGLGMA